MLRNYVQQNQSLSQTLSPSERKYASSVTLSFAQPRKILTEFSKLPAVLKHRGKNFVMMTSSVRHRREPTKMRE